MDYITGSSGFIGSRLLTQLHKLNRDVHTIPHEAIYTSKLDPFHSFYFLSSYGNLWNQQDIDETINANVYDLIHILRLAVKQQFRSFVYMSTSSVKLNVQTSYSRAKRAAEEIVLAYMEKYKLSMAIVRPFSVTGVGEQKDHLIPKLIHAAKTGEVINFVPQATHDYIDVDDVVEALINLSSHGVRGIYELGWGKEWTNDEVKQLVEKVTGKTIKTNIVTTMRPYDTDHWHSINFKSRSWGWQPVKPLEQSIRDMVAAYDNQK